MYIHADGHARQCLACPGLQHKTGLHAQRAEGRQHGGRATRAQRCGGTGTATVTQHTRRDDGIAQVLHVTHIEQVAQRLVHRAAVRLLCAVVARGAPHSDVCTQGSYLLRGGHWHPAYQPVGVQRDIHALGQHGPHSRHVCCADAARRGAVCVQRGVAGSGHSSSAVTRHGRSSSAVAGRGPSSSAVAGPGRRSCAVAAGPWSRRRDVATRPCTRREALAGAGASACASTDAWASAWPRRVCDTRPGTCLCAVAAARATTVEGAVANIALQNSHERPTAVVWLST
mmetsp:Transcript_36581/g.91714  ORF Transcript_36581/g.91714 Transcript_36581/m.91714 type:complete len:285 (+) Transcript_36581:167-1021(+)